MKKLCAQTNGINHDQSKQAPSLCQQLDHDTALANQREHKEEGYESQGWGGERAYSSNTQEAEARSRVQGQSELHSKGVRGEDVAQLVFAEHTGSWSSILCTASITGTWCQTLETQLLRR